MPEIRREHYEFRIQGYLHSRWVEWLGCQELIHTMNGETILSCLIQDQAALHGLLAKIRDMNLKLLSVNRVEPQRADDEDRRITR